VDKNAMIKMREQKKRPIGPLSSSAPAAGFTPAQPDQLLY
jgi:hypothetical protein